MADLYESERVISGTFGEAWVDNDYIGDITKCECEVSLNYDEVKKVRTLWTGHKLISCSGSGTLTYNKTRSNLEYDIAAALSEGKARTFDVITNLDDPDAYGAERVKYTGCKPTSIKPTDFENGKAGEGSLPFTFEGFEFIDYIDHSYTQPAEEGF